MCYEVPTGNLNKSIFTIFLFLLNFRNIRKEPNLFNKAQSHKISVDVHKNTPNVLCTQWQWHCVHNDTVYTMTHATCIQKAVNSAEQSSCSSMVNCGPYKELGQIRNKQAQTSLLFKCFFFMFSSNNCNPWCMVQRGELSLNIEFIFVYLYCLYC